jgi:hypothetical protein
MCKTSASRQSIRWTGGFHGSNREPSFGALYLLHTRWMDVTQTLNRLRITREVEWSRDKPTYQKADDETILKKFSGFDEWPVELDADFYFTAEVKALIDGTTIVQEAYRLPQGIRPRKMFCLPDWFFRDII